MVVEMTMPPSAAAASNAQEDASIYGIGAADSPRAVTDLRILIVCEHASNKMGGEAARPLHYFRVMRAHGVEAWLVIHARTQEELRTLMPAEEFARVHFIPDTVTQKLLWQVGRFLPHQVRIVTFGAVSHWLTQIKQRKLVRQLVGSLKIDIVHEPIPISPKQPSAMYDVGAPVIIGPLNGNINYPPAFAHMESPVVKWSVRVSRFLSKIANRMEPGKLKADVILVSNPRTRDALPAGVRGRVVELVANAVDMSTWKPKPPRARRALPVRLPGAAGGLQDGGCSARRLQAGCREVRRHARHHRRRAGQAAA